MADPADLLTAAKIAQQLSVSDANGQKISASQRPNRPRQGHGTPATARHART
jgi:hypothetical protein